MDEHICGFLPGEILAKSFQDFGQSIKKEFQELNWRGLNVKEKNHVLPNKTLCDFCACRQVCMYKDETAVYIKKAILYNPLTIPDNIKVNVMCDYYIED